MLKLFPILLLLAPACSAQVTGGTALSPGANSQGVTLTYGTAAATPSTGGTGGGGGGGGGGITCGPPLYRCTRTDLVPLALPATVPNVGGLSGRNTIVTDDFGNNNRILRVTDSSFNSNLANHSVVTDSSGSGDENLFSRVVNGHYLLCLNDEGTSLYPVDFNPTTFQTSRIYASNFPSTNGMVAGAGGCSWAFTSNKMYTMSGAGALQSYDFTDWLSGPQTTPPTVTTEFDYANSTCLGSGNSVYWTADGGHSKDDTIFASAFAAYPDWSATHSYGAQSLIVPATGNAQHDTFWTTSGGTSGGSAPTWNQTTGAIITDGSVTWVNIGSGQGTGTTIAAYKPGSGCTYLNTLTGAVGGDWGATGTSSTMAANPMFLHNAKMFKSGSSAYIVIVCTSQSARTGIGCASGQPYAWQIGTTNIVKLSGSGHFTEGNSTWVNGCNNQPAQQCKEPVTSPGLVQIFGTGQRPTGIAYPQDMHSGWNNVDASDTVPILLTTYEGGNTHSAGVLNCSGTTTCSWVAGHQFSSSWTGFVEVAGLGYTISGTPTATSLSLTTAGPSGNVPFAFKAYSVAWDAEVQAMSPVTGTVWRFSHCFKTGEDAKIFDGGFCIGSVSQDGLYYIFASDWLGTLGSESGASSGCISTSNCRTDTFLIELR